MPQFISKDKQKITHNASARTATYYTQNSAHHPQKTNEDIGQHKYQHKKHGQSINTTSFTYKYLPQCS